MLRTSQVLKAVLAAGLAAAAVLASAQGYVPNRVLLKFSAGTPNAKAQAILASVGARIERELPQIGVEVLQLPANANEQAVANALAHKPNVEFAELDTIHEPDQAVPSDPYYMYEWHLPKISAPSAWSLATGSGSVVIAILDTGCDATHPDLMSKYVAGWNVYSNNSDTSDVYGHGTTVAGTAAAASNNGAGVASLAWGCSIMPIRVSALDGTAAASTIATGLTWAADHGAKVANISYQVTTSSAVTSAAQYFQTKGGVVCVSAGNYSTQHTNPDNAYILTVDATDSNDALASFSDYGSDIDLAAPGTAIWTTTKGGGYASAGGTSYSAPLVAGAAALVMSANPTLSPQQVRDLLKSTADDLGAPGWDPIYGSGRLNVGRAVSMALSGGGTGGGDTTPPTAAFAQPTAGMTLQGTYTVLAQGSDNVGVTGMTISLDGVQVASSTSGSCSYTWNTLNATNANHTLTVVARDAANNTGTQTITVGVYNPLDTTPPSVAILSPTGGNVGNSVSVSNSASDNVGVAKVELYLDNKLVGTDTSAPWSFNLNSRKWAKGNHSLQAKAYDAASNSAVSQIVTVSK